MRAPRYKLCHYCGRRVHQVAVRLADGTVLGCCPTCWTGKPGYGIAVAVRFFPEQVLYDHRSRKAPLFLGVRDGERRWAAPDALRLPDQKDA
jgi:hypothetical protein